MVSPREAHELVQRWFAEGEAAAIASQPASTCPYSPGTIPEFWWCQGFLLQIAMMQCSALGARVSLLQKRQVDDRPGSDRN